MDDQRIQRTPPPTATELLRLVEARIISVEEARRFLFGQRPEKNYFTDDHARLQDEVGQHRRTSGKHMRPAGMVVL
jgi:hypothetical protein